MTTTEFLQPWPVKAWPDTGKPLEGAKESNHSSRFLSGLCLCGTNRLPRENDCGIYLRRTHNESTAIQVDQRRRTPDSARPTSASYPHHDGVPRIRRSRSEVPGRSFLGAWADRTIRPKPQRMGGGIERTRCYRIDIITRLLWIANPTSPKPKTTAYMDGSGTGTVIIVNSFIFPSASKISSSTSPGSPVLPKT